MKLTVLCWAKNVGHHPSFAWPMSGNGGVTAEPRGLRNLEKPCPRCSKEKLAKFFTQQGLSKDASKWSGSKTKLTSSYLYLTNLAQLGIYFSEKKKNKKHSFAFVTAETNSIALKTKCWNVGGLVKAQYLMNVRSLKIFTFCTKILK